MGHEVHDDGYRDSYQWVMNRAVALVQWLNLPAWKIYSLENRRLWVRAPTGIQVSKKQIVTSSLTCEYLILWEASVTER